MDEFLNKIFTSIRYNSEPIRLSDLRADSFDQKSKNLLDEFGRESIDNALIVHRKWSQLFCDNLHAVAKMKIDDFLSHIIGKFAKNRISGK